MDKKNWIRPYWHVDAKWIFAILFYTSLIITSLTFTLSRLTSETVAVPVASYIVASQFSREGLDDPTDIEEIKSQYLEGDQVIFNPLPDMDIVITRQELETLSPKELRLRIFEQVVEPIYTQTSSETGTGELGLLAFFNQDTHKLLQKIFLISLLPLILTGIGLVGFSYRYGRLISPALLLLMIGTVPAILLFIIQRSNPSLDNQGPFSILPKELLLQITTSISPLYYTLFLLGLGLIFTAVLIKLSSKHKS